MFRQLGSPLIGPDLELYLTGWELVFSDWLAAGKFSDWLAAVKFSDWLAGGKSSRCGQHSRAIASLADSWVILSYIDSQKKTVVG